MPSLKTWILLSGLLHILLVAGSMLIPFLLNWKEELGKVSTLIRQMFWTYAGYILALNLFFGLISFFIPESLMDGSPLATAVTLLIALYWTGRILIQFFYFDRSSAPKGLIYTLGEVGLVTMFVFFSVVYSYVFYYNLQIPKCTSSCLINLRFCFYL